ncbi:MAG: ATP-binding protein, partial [Gemmatimonadota bacterium]
VRGLLEGVLEFVETELERVQAEVSWEGAEACWALGDPELLERVFLNVIMNALQALESAPAPRRIRVRVGTRTEAAEAAVCLVEIQDSGAGVPPEAREQIFRPYQTSRAGGTGLGLALARSIVLEHGGRIEVGDAGEPLGGALMRIQLPATSAPEHEHG